VAQSRLGKQANFFPAMPNVSTSFERALQIHLCAALLFVVGPELTARRWFEGKTCCHASTIENWQSRRAPEGEMMMKCTANIPSRP